MTTNPDKMRAFEAAIETMDYPELSAAQDLIAAKAGEMREAQIEALRVRFEAEAAALNLFATMNFEGRRKKRRNSARNGHTAT